jgi:excisionase family DNA binding protein
MNTNISISQASEQCNVSRATIWRWIKSGKLKASKTAGGHHRINEKDFQDFMDDQQMHSQYRDSAVKRILIVDDDAMIRKYLKRLLDHANVELAFSADGFDAGVKAVKFKPDLIILDLFMPKLDGFDVCRKLKETKETASSKIIAISGYGNNFNLKRIHLAGADAFLPKPIESGLMLKKIDELLGINLLKRIAV